MIRWLFGVAVFSVMAVSLCAVFCLNRYLDTPLNIGSEGVVYEFKKGGSLSVAVNELAEQGVLVNPRWLLLYVKLTRQGSKINAGEYLLQPQLTPRSMLALFSSGDVIQYKLTLPEGWNYIQVLAELQKHPKLDRKILTKDAEDLSRLLDIQHLARHPEGMFFPDTYRYQKGMSDIDILRIAHKKMLTVLDEEWKNREQGLPLATPYEALILASIVEKETAVGYERAKIAGVFIRRLKKNMRLQTDPTVIYGLGASYQGNLKKKHLREKTAYNTYRIKGLPPTPIAMPGRDAIHAVLHPASGDELYFVAKGDGSHYFSVTLDEHNKAVQRFQKNRRAKNYRSTPLK
jgi:UPF0755 protein